MGSLFCVHTTNVTGEINRQNVQYFIVADMAVVLLDVICVAIFVVR